MTEARIIATGTEMQFFLTRSERAKESLAQVVDNIERYEKQIKSGKKAGESDWALLSVKNTLDGEYHLKQQLLEEIEGCEVQCRKLSVAIAGLQNLESVTKQHYKAQLHLAVQQQRIEKIDTEITRLHGLRTAACERYTEASRRLGLLDQQLAGVWFTGRPVVYALGINSGDDVLVWACTDKDMLADVLEMFKRQLIERGWAVSVDQATSKLDQRNLFLQITEANCILDPDNKAHLVAAITRMVANSPAVPMVNPDDIIRGLRENRGPEVKRLRLTYEDESANKQTNNK